MITHADVARSSLEPTITQGMSGTPQKAVICGAGGSGQLHEVARGENGKTYLVNNDLNHVERVLGGDRVDQDITMYANRMFGVKNAVFVLASSVYDFAVPFCATVLDGLGEGRLDGGIVGLEEFALDIL